MQWFDVEAGDPDSHDNHRPAHQCLGPESVDPVPIFLGFKSLLNTKAVEAVHFDLAEVQRDAHGDEYESEAHESDGGLCVYGFHMVLFAPLNSPPSAVSVIFSIIFYNILGT